MKTLNDSQFEELIAAVINDGVIDDKEKKVLYKRAKERDIDSEEMDIILKKRLNDKLNAGTRVCPNPNCKEKISDTALKCPNCGKEFNPGELLSAKLDKADNVNKQISIIFAFPIPAQSKDLEDFTRSMIAKLVDSEDPLFFAYKLKCQQCLSSANISITDSQEISIFKDLQEAFDKKNKFFDKQIKKNKKKAEKKQRKQWQEQLKDAHDPDGSKRMVKYIWNSVGAIIAIGVIVFFCTLITKCVYPPKSIAVATDADECAAAIAAAMSNNQLDSAKALVFNYQGKDSLGRSCIAVADAYLRSGDTATAKEVAKHAGNDPNDLLQFFIKAKDFDEADKYIKRPMDNKDDDNARHYYDFLASAVKSMCADGKKQEAIAFINAKVGSFLEGKYGINHFSFERVDAQLMSIVNSYGTKSYSAKIYKKRKNI
ncbi:MAG: zinc ribbon domain-containing protein [Muribaculaceae bacterium]|jgi:hypothetical protein|nr:zinc ribbon domain-containing protein [Muribaculaceae bacterium]